MPPLFLLLALAAVLAGGVHWFFYSREQSQPPGVLAPDAPRQEVLADALPIEHKGHRVLPRAEFEITARVLRKEIYRMDGGAGLAPVDLAVGWGPASDSRVVEALSFSQMGRFFYWEPRDPAAFPLTARELVDKVAQIHLVPGVPGIEGRLKRLRPGQVVTLRGKLIDVEGPNGYAWRTSLTREDTGNGACELLWVESVLVR
jgi:hypothetical protein